ncbi:MAG: hypothetical protein JW985_00995 [Alphaproteobacteria bacterium]|nr:hypothetical protein [Alphaproteobacteria bacterium]
MHDSDCGDACVCSYNNQCVALQKSCTTYLPIENGERRTCTDSPPCLDDICTYEECNCDTGYHSAGYYPECYCEVDCTDSNCKDGDWLSHMNYPGYEEKINRHCSDDICIETKSYRCYKGYFGNPTSFINGCEKCSIATGNPGATSMTGSTSITQCYIPTGYKSSDYSGSFEYTSNCYYSL